MRRRKLSRWAIVFKVLFSRSPEERLRALLSTPAIQSWDNPKPISAAQLNEFAEAIGAMSKDQV